MQLLRTTRAEDRPKSPLVAPAPLLLESLLGVWVNTNRLSRGIDRLIVGLESGETCLRILGSGSPAPIDWGTVRIKTICAKDVNSVEPMAFEANFDLGFLEVQAQANFSLGLLVLACFNTFKDESGRRNYFSREFFHRADIEEVVG